MTAHLDVAVGDAGMALDGGGWGDDTLGEQGESLRRLEGGTRSIGFADGLTHITAIGRVSSETEDLAIGGVDGNDAARLVLQQSFSELLEYRTQGEWPVGRQGLRKEVCDPKQASDSEDISVCHCSKEKILRCRSEGL